MSIGQAFALWFLFMCCFILGAYVWEGIKLAAYDQAQQRKELAKLRRHNSELRDEIERLKHGTARTGHNNHR